MIIDQHEKAARFRALHDGPDTFVIPNTWDVVSSRLLAGLGFQALATSSAAAAATFAQRDGHISREQALEHSHLIVTATDLPVSADLERGFGDRPETVAETIGGRPPSASSAARSRIRPAIPIVRSTMKPWRSRESRPRPKPRGRCASRSR